MMKDKSMTSALIILITVIRGAESSFTLPVCKQNGRAVTIDKLNYILD